MWTTCRAYSNQCGDDGFSRDAHAVERSTLLGAAMTAPNDSRPTLVLAWVGRRATRPHALFTTAAGRNAQHLGFISCDRHEKYWSFDASITAGMDSGDGCAGTGVGTGGGGGGAAAAASPTAATASAFLAAGTKAAFTKMNDASVMPICFTVRPSMRPVMSVPPTTSVNRWGGTLNVVAMACLTSNMRSPEYTAN